MERWAAYFSPVTSEEEINYALSNEEAVAMVNSRW